MIMATASYLLLSIITAGHNPAYAITGDGTQANPYDIGTGDLVIIGDQIQPDGKDRQIYVKGTTNNNRIIFGTAKHAGLHLTGVKMDFKTGRNGKDIREEPCIGIADDSVVTIYIDSNTTNVLYGGNDHGAGRNNGQPAIQVDEKATLNLEVWGALDATGGDGGNDRGAAAIGCRDNDSSSGKINVHIHDYGYLKAVAKYGGAGIGGGNNAHTKDISILLDGQAKLETAGMEGGAAIGGGDDGQCGNITVTGTSMNTTVIAAGGYGAAGIGGGCDGECSSVTVDGVGTVIASSPHKGAGIGAGDHDGTGTGGNIGSVTVKNCGHVEATGGDEGGSGIGGSEDCDIDSVTVENCGEVIASGGTGGAGIGTGKDSNGGVTIECGPVTVKNSKVTAWCRDGMGAGIGAGEHGKVSAIIITGERDITATGHNEAAGIGCGDDGEIGDISITNIQATITATAGGAYGAGIGACDADCGKITLDLQGGTVVAKGGYNGAGVGAGDAGDCGDIEITGHGTLTATGGFDAAAIGGGEGTTCGKITIAGDDQYQTKTHYSDPGEYALTVSAIGHREKESVTVQYAALIGGKESGDISIKNTDISLTYPEASAMYGACIGCGKDGSVGMISITHSRVALTDLDINYADENGYTGYNIYGATIGEAYGGDVNTIVLDDVDYYGRTIGGATWDGADIDSITISNSKIYADAEDTTVTVVSPEHDDKRSGAQPIAGIGSGKDAAINSISISNSDVQAFGKNGGAGIGSGGYYVDLSSIGLVFQSGGEVGDITIEKSTVTATSSCGGAGIGSGLMTSVEGTIKITGSKVTATAGTTSYWDAGGAGIGAGEMEGCNRIIIGGSGDGESCEIIATGAPGSAGIGGGGCRESNLVSGITQGIWDPELGDIEITSSTVTATGGVDGAGIGLGKGAQQTSGKHLTITDSVVTAKGGDFAAGIGGGNNAEFERGGDFGNITISGKSRVEATGGAEAAGIGGGSQGSLYGCTIDVESQIDPSTHEPKYYVKAWGGHGGAGIGSGASHAMNNIASQYKGYTADNIKIDRGWIYAYGGGDFELTDWTGKTKEWIGAGAGIGGGAKGGLRGFEINDGVVKAGCQTSNNIPGLNVRQANPIGHGGGYIDALFHDNDCENFKINGGTIDADLCNEVGIEVSGGCILQNIDGERAHNGDKKVYKNTLNLDLSKVANGAVLFEGRNYYPVQVSSVSSEYGNHGIYAVGTSDSRAQIGLYLPESGTDEAFAVVNGFSSSYYRGSPRYYGTTNKDNNNILRIGSKIELVPENEYSVPAVGEEFKLFVKPESENGIPEGESYTFTASGLSSPQITELANAGESPYVVVTPYQTGDLRVLAEGTGRTDDIYWAVQPAEYLATVAAEKVQLMIAKDLSKVYDGRKSYLEVLATIDQYPDYTPDILVEPEEARGAAGRNLKVSYQNDEIPGRGISEAVEPGKYTATVVCRDQNVENGIITIDGTQYAPNTVQQSFTIEKYRQAFEVMSPKPVLCIEKGSTAQITPEWKLTVTNTDAEGNPVIPVLPYSDPNASKDDGGLVTVQYRYLDDPEQKVSEEAPTGIGRYQMILHAKETAHFYEADLVYDFSIVEGESSNLKIDVEDKIYDGLPAEPDITSYRQNDEITTVYYRMETDGTETLLDGVPVDAGKYKAVASVEDRQPYMAGSASDEFEILKMSPMLGISVTEGAGEGADILVSVANGISDMAGKPIILTVSDENNTQTFEEPIERNEEKGRTYATYHFDSVPAGDYAVVAEYNKDGGLSNYNPATVSTTLRKDWNQYFVTADKLAFTYHDGPADLYYEITDRSGSVIDPETADVTFTSSDPKVASVDQSGKVTPGKPGICKINISVAGDDTHLEGTGAAAVEVKKGSFTPKVLVSDKVYDGNPVTLSLEGIPDDYEGLDPGLVYFYYEKIGDEYVLIGNSDTDKLQVKDAGEYFVLLVCTRDRNYKAAEAMAVFTISPALLSVKTGSKEKKYDGKPLTCEEAEVTGFAAQETAKIKATGSQTEVGSSDNTYAITWAGEDPEITAYAKNYQISKEELGTLTVTPPDAGPFYIRTYQDLENMAKNVRENPGTYAGAEYIVMNNIKAPADSSWVMGVGSVSEKIPFTGSLEGNGYCIFGLNINMPENGGLFEWIGEGGSVQNLYLFDCDYSASSRVGGGIAAVNDGTISYCVNGVNATTGVYVELNTGELIPLEEFNSSVSGVIIGGIAGQNGGTIFGCRSTAVINGTGTIGGGIAGENKGTIDNCAANNSISSGDHDGAEETFLGGLCGENEGTITGGYSSALLSAPESAFLGNIVGAGNNGSLIDIYYTTSEGQLYQGGGISASETNISGMARGKMMQDSFVEQLTGTASNKVSWLRTDGLNAGLPRIQNPSTAFADRNLVNGSGNLHVGAKFVIQPLRSGTEAWNLLSDGLQDQQVDSAFVCMVTDADGNYIPAELWTQSDLVYSVPVKNPDVRIKALMEDGTVRTVNAAVTSNDSGGYLASFKSTGVVSIMAISQNGAAQSSNTNTGVQSSPNGVESSTGVVSNVATPQNGTVKSPNTGDQSSPTLYLGMLVAAVLSGVGAIILKKTR